MKNERRAELARKKSELEEQITELQKELLKERERDLIRIVDSFKAELEAHELTIDDAAELLDLPHRSSSTPKAPEAISKKKATITYKNPNGPGAWAGKGRKPTWLKEALQNGQPLKSFEVPS